MNYDTLNNKASFSRIVWHQAWKQSGTILV